ncbi:hypothetical protein [Streptoalloteichus tenebrarius]|uniref:hypothetical protein n=1 Tax=Streptoalloteichus tenebrarius (strain ATCC 17920 / DSM 40477 / JCM 4838 / CBS 697.72 / NBRC 16177 / NCIMB 11028 / NRRL B-12390 / A12253. 1 / ISP 5477) TaxID=1933 RepID=UPI0020A3DED9|nr:hypothetical protein [Streptoalloteichus tenebrarius]BFF03509.1 hypothetical protein GCM10020241_51840 [Streptoalloteichus tenebrarius]
MAEMDWDDWHRVEYLRQVRGAFYAQYAQRVNDAGFHLGRRVGYDPAPDYTKVVADEWFGRVGRPPGERWRVRVWRLPDDAVARPVCEIEVLTATPGRPTNLLAVRFSLVPRAGNRGSDSHTRRRPGT